MPRKPESSQPISQVEWQPRDWITANDYNPNHVPARELDLLATSIQTDGWTQPIVVSTDLVIIDGFHRWTVAGRPEIAEMTGGLVPTVMLPAADDIGRRMATVRHNRARGNHLIKHMATLLDDLRADGVDTDDLIAGMGMDDEEIRRLGDHRKSVAAEYADHQPTTLEM